MKKIFLFFIFITSVFSVVYATEIDDNIQFSEISGEEMFVESEYNFDSEISYDDMEYKYLKGKVEEAGEIYNEDVGYYNFSYQDVKVSIEDEGYNTVKTIRHSLSY